MTPDAFNEFAKEPDERLTVKPGELTDGDELTVKLDGEPEVFDSDRYGRGFSIPALFVHSDVEHTGEDDVPIEGGDEVNIVSWSKRLARAFRAHASDHGWDGEVTVAKSGEGMDAEYTVEPAGEDE